MVYTMSMTNTEIRPTAEQQQIIDAFATEQDMVIEAGAGTGKTSTLRMVAESTDRTGCYVVYNKAAQLDAKASYPENVDCRTAHSLAYAGMMRLPNGKQITRRAHDRTSVPSRTLVKALGIPAAYQSDEQMIPDWVIAGSAVQAVKNFANSADPEITEYHVPKIDGLEDQRSYKQYVVQYAQKVWDDCQKPNGFAKVTPDHYLKMWALTEPTIKGEFIMLDEAQDTNPVLLKVIADQTQQKVIVGDRCQQLYAWRGAVNAMTDFEGQHKLCLSQSFRFGQAVAEHANKFLDLLEAPLRLTGFSKIESKIHDGETEMTPDAILCRTNAAVIQHAMAEQKRGKRVAIVGGTTQIEIFAKGARDLQQGRRSSSPELVAFKSWHEVQQYSQTDEGTDMRVMVKLVDEYGVDAILAVCAASVNEKTADVVCSTAHKSKGREWNRVKIAEDFEAPKDGVEPSHADLCLAYVAVTRGKLVLDPGALAWINNYNKAVAA
jgi:hypothetical protein